VNVLDDDDGVVDQDANRENQRKQRNTIEGESPGPGGKQRRGKSQADRHADNQRFTLAKRKEDQEDHESGGEDQLADQLLRLVGRRLAVITCRRDFDPGRDQRAFERLGTSDDGTGDVGGIDPRFLRNLHGNRRKLAVSIAEPDVLARLIGAFLNARDIADEDRLALTASAAHGNDQLPDVGRGFEIAASFDEDLAVFGDQTSRRLAGVTSTQGGGNILRGHRKSVHALAVHRHAQHVIGTAERGHVTRSLDSLEVHFGGARHLLQIESRALGVGAPEGQRNDRHIIDAARLDHWFEHAEIRRQPVAVGMYGVVETHDGIVVLDADFELHGDHRHSRSRHRVHMLDTRHSRQDLFGGRGHQILDVLHRRAGKGDEHVGHGDVDLRLFLARRDQGGKNAHQQRDQRQQGRHLRAGKETGDAAGNTHYATLPAASPTSGRWPLLRGRGRHARRRADRRALRPHRCRRFRQGAAGARTARRPDSGHKRQSPRHA
jgi:hypothetical protein